MIGLIEKNKAWYLLAQRCVGSGFGILQPCGTKRVAFESANERLKNDAKATQRFGYFRCSNTTASRILGGHDTTQATKVELHDWTEISGVVKISSSRH